MYQPIIGLEIHIELDTKSKMFCSCVNDPNERYANINICPICTAQPGTLPVINKEAVRKTIRTGLALNCQISEYSKFDRKNYFYPDLPKGYQISQYDAPFCKNGYLEIPVSDEVSNDEIKNPSEPEVLKGRRQKSKIKKIKITRVHLEEDTGKLVHPKDKDYSLVNFNRAGIPLMELVTEPDLRTAKEARRFAEEFQLIVRYLDVSNADMEKGQMRVEVNISLSQKSKVKSQKLGTKVEIKNLNSFRAVEQAINYEIKRQADVLDRGDKVIQETRGWDEKKGITVSQREKEQAHDYRYFPEPDLPTLRFSKDYIKEIELEVPELPQAKRARFIEEYNLNEENVNIFIANNELSNYFEKVISELINWVKEIEGKKMVSEKEKNKLVKFSLNYITTDLQGLLKGGSVADKDFKITPENFAEFIALIYEGKLSSKMAKDVLSEMFKTGADPSHIIEDKGLVQITDQAEIEKIVKRVIAKNPKPVEDYKKGKENALQFLIGQVMAATKGRANPDKVQQLLKKMLR